jgi:uncharacterized protein (DUF169 family)
MSVYPVDLSILKEMGFERPPVGVKYLFAKPEGINRVEKKIRICDMLVEAWAGEPFYAQKEDIMCVGRVILGMVSRDPILESGMLGPKMELFQDARVNKQLYRVAPRLEVGECRYVVFAPLDKITFDPDVLIITANSPKQAAIFERALTYATLNVFTSHTAPALGCAWVYIGPYLNGEPNYVISPVGFGTDIMEEGLIMISVPYQILPNLIGTLEDKTWIPNWVGSTQDELAEESKKHISELEELTGVKCESEWAC